MRSIEEIKATRNLFIEAEAPNDGMGGYYYDSISNKRLNFIFSYQMGWEHLSVSMPSRTPTWEQMCKMKDIFWGKDEEIKNLQGSLQTYEIILKTNLEAYTNENYKQRKIINHLSRKIQNKNKKYKQLQARKMPPTMYGKEVVIVPDSIANEIMIVDKKFFDIGSDIK